MKFSILIADDEKNIRTGLKQALEGEGYNIYLAANGAEALTIVKKDKIDIVITDLKMPEMSGEELLKKINKDYKGIPVIMLTGHGTVENAVQAMREGAYDFITKPLNLDHLFLIVKRALSNRQLQMQHKALQEEVDKIKNRNKYLNLIGKSSVMKKVVETIDQVAATKASVLITGESGVGKEVVSDVIHNLSDRKDKPFIKVHCAALSESLLESELFGHEKGAFTGAIARKKGRFELADKGTIFLDEIGEINQSLQVKLLRVLQEKTFERVGGEEEITVDVRIISATNKNLEKEVEKGNFREDLYYRLNVVNLHIPPLRERQEDIPLLIAYFLKEFSEENGKNIESIDAKAQAALSNYKWKGNIRELRNCIESAVVMTKNRIINYDDLPVSIKNESNVDNIIIKPGTPLSEVERIVITKTLTVLNGNKSKTADVLGIGRKTLHRKLDEYNIE
ncbi:MAG: sigma-54 dependent transcriptional regulator [Spirochaetes bacterium]|nr:sigma-54 dependent transcriptional regulator [Spirochaetota bacterium]